MKRISAALAAAWALAAGGVVQAQTVTPDPVKSVTKPMPVRLPPAPPSPPPRPPSPQSRLEALGPNPLRGAPIYVYNFLDVRDTYYGDKVLAQVDQQLIEALGERGSEAKVARFRPLLRQAGLSFDGSYVPVARTIWTNRAEERASGAKFRLIVFPSNYTVSGAWRFYEVRWVLIDVRTGAEIWTHSYSGKHLVMLRTNENSKGRGRKLVSSAIVEMDKAGLF